MYAHWRTLSNWCRQMAYSPNATFCHRPLVAHRLPVPIPLGKPRRYGCFQATWSQRSKRAICTGNTYLGTWDSHSNHGETNWAMHQNWSWYWHWQQQGYCTSWGCFGTNSAVSEKLPLVQNFNAYKSAMDAYHRILIQTCGKHYFVDIWRLPSEAVDTCISHNFYEEISGTWAQCSLLGAG